MLAVMPVKSGLRSYGGLQMKAWLQAFGYSDAIKDATINAILREFFQLM